MAQLTALPGVGRKTANVVLGHALGVPGLPVDRHVLRVSNRIGIAESDDPEIVERQLCDALPPQTWTLASDVQILHGRRICRPRPLCPECSVREYCDYYRTVVVPEAVTRPAKAARAAGTKGAATSIRTAEITKPGKGRNPPAGRTVSGTVRADPQSRKRRT